MNDLKALPSCMMPDGADPCAGYSELHHKFLQQQKEIAELKQWIFDCKDQILYPLSHGDDEIARTCYSFGAATVDLLTATSR